MATESQRRERVANGSRRKRDLAVAERGVNAEDFARFASEHFPNESRYTVQRHAFHLWNEQGRGRLPSPSQVRERMQQAGETAAQLGGSE